MIMEPQSEQLKREAEEARWQLSATLDELRARMTPGRVVDQLIDYTRDGPVAEFLRNLGREARENPMPLALIGIGVAWLIVASNRTSRAIVASAADAVASKAAELGSATSAAVVTTSEWGEQTVARVADRASDVASTVGDKTAELASHARDLRDKLGEKARTVTTVAGAVVGKAKWPLASAPESGHAFERSTGYKSAMPAVSDHEATNETMHKENAGAVEAANDHG
jgi:Protein of unknown function (DUF3618)